MSLIKILPDNIANQIAAGEVVQRPASVIKELMENAVDAGSSKISVLIKEAGKTLIQIGDNGSGMAETDARLSFECHATSKISSADDLYAIRTMGFRGEALSSIASIAQVELKTKRTEDELGTLIQIEGSEIKKQESCSCANGSLFAVKNLFFNVPARRNFLKSNNVEMNHIIEEFQRIALIHFDVGFSLFNGDNEVFHLDQSNFKQRIVSLFGNNYNQRLLPVEEKTDLFDISGFIVKPEFAKARRGEQYLFVNKRFVKHHALNHAIQKAFEGTIQDNYFPSFFLNITIDPKHIDINIHPTKTEIKFDDENIMYRFVGSAIKQALGKFHLAPTLDFESETYFEIPVFSANKPIVEPQITVDPTYNPFENKSTYTPVNRNRYGGNQPKLNLKSNQDWERMYSEKSDFPKAQIIEEHQKAVGGDIAPLFSEENSYTPEKKILQLQNKYLITPVKSGIMIINRQYAIERIIFERLLFQLEKNKSFSQQFLFPETIELNAADVELFKGLIDDINAIGFDIREFGKNTFVVYGAPPEIQVEDIHFIIDYFMDEYKVNIENFRKNKNEQIAKTLARTIALKNSKPLSEEEVSKLIDQLFACQNPTLSPWGKSIVKIMNMEEIDTKFIH